MVVPQLNARLVKMVLPEVTVAFNTAEVVVILVAALVVSKVLLPVVVNCCWPP